MRFIPRAIQPAVLEASRGFPAVVITGPRRAGKTTLSRGLFRRATYVLLEDPDIQARARSDPRALLDELRLPALFDEIQNVPELFGYIRTRIDRDPRKMGQWLFTGSQEAPLMRGVAESMAGRAAIMQLLPFSLAETRQLFHGFREGIPPSQRWQALARRKLAELEELERKIAATKELMQVPCACRDLAECGRRILAKHPRGRRSTRSGSLPAD